jgi:hypothetical protein
MKDIDDVNRALSDVNKELEVKANHDDLNNVVTDQAIINESLCTENIVSRLENNIQNNFFQEY